MYCWQKNTTYREHQKVFPKKGDILMRSGNKNLFISSIMSILIVYSMYAFSMDTNNSKDDNNKVRNINGIASTHKKDIVYMNQNNSKTKVPYNPEIPLFREYKV